MRGMKQVEGITTETTLLLQKTNDLAEDVNYKVDRLNSVFDGVHEVGETFHNLTLSMKKLSNTVNKAADVDSEKAEEAVKWTSAIVNVFKNRKN